MLNKFALLSAVSYDRVRICGENMEDIDNKLEQFREKAETTIKKNLEDYPDFKTMELEYCSLINEGNSIRSLVLQNPELCDNSTYLILTKQVAYNRVGKIRGRFAALQLVPLLSKKLFENYKSQLEVLQKEENYPELINLNEQMYRFSNKYIYRKNIADILYQKYKNFKQAMEIYNEIEPQEPEDAEYWKNYAELNEEYENFEKRDECLKKSQVYGLNSGIQKLLDDEKFDEAIKVDEQLFDLTGDYRYKLAIANIIGICKNDLNKAVKIYKENESNSGNDKNYWYQLSDLYKRKKNYYRQVLSLQKAIDIELSEPEKVSGAGV